MPVDHQLLDALEILWCIPPPGPDNLWSTPAFVTLKDLCAQQYGNGKATLGLTFALSNALRSLGLPCWQPPTPLDPALDLESVAANLAKAFSRRTTVRRYICPLDLADDLPSLAFGNARLAQLTAKDLDILFDRSRLARHFPALPLDSDRLAQFHWLVVEEEIEIDREAGARALPFLSMRMDRDLGEIDPHLSRFPSAVEDALFFLLLAPWEEWSTMNEVDWRGFRIPWIYTLDEDLFVAPSRPPSPDSLSLEPLIVQNDWGDEIELERPSALQLDDCASLEMQHMNDAAWTELKAARATPLFETPVVHFLVRAFLADGVDEVIAHLTVIEAALGLESDHRPKLRPKPDPHSRLSPTKRVAARLGAALNEIKVAQDYMDLFDLRSEFIHGRAGLQKISTRKRVLARSIARRIVRALIPLATNPALSRDEILSKLLAKGAEHTS
jgi:hypothetical protein